MSLIFIKRNNPDCQATDPGRQTLWLGATAILLLALTGCGGGGGGAPGALIIPDRTPVKVAVIDQGFDINHPEIRDAVVGAIACTRVMPSGAACDTTTSMLNNTGDPHGTYVAQIIAGKTVGYTEDAALLLGKATDLYVSEIAAATNWALDSGARIVNYSLYPMFEVDPYMRTAYDNAVNKGAALIMAAGNKAISLSNYAYSYPSLFSNADYTGISLLAGAGLASGGTYVLQSFSNYPGADTTIQSRFLVALTPVNVIEADGSTIATFNGTSASAPVISAALTSLLAQWPHLTPQQSTGILLDTADRTFSGYDPFYFGQGVLDAERALQPVGVTALPTGNQVGGASYSVAGTRFVLPAAFGDAASSLSLDAAMFDSYGRDYSFNLASQLGQTDFWKTAGQHWMGLLAGDTREHRDSGLFTKTSFDQQGGLTQSYADFTPGDGHRLSLMRTRGRSLENEAAPVQMLSLTGNGALGAYDWLDRVGVAWQLNGKARLDARTTRATAPSGGISSDASAWRHETRLSFEPDASTSISVGLALTQESGAAMGTSGTGAFALNQSFSQATTFRLRHDLGRRWAAFGSAEIGTMKVAGETLLTDISNVMTSEWAAGIAWQGDDRSFGLALSQPLRVDHARASFNLPVGRLADGTVLRQSRSVSLTPTGQQLNLELAYRQRWVGAGGRHSALGLHMVYAHDVGHVAGARALTLMGSHRYHW
ncbi:S8 family peptidase [Thiobacillus denitrificans]|uniref:S8 family peptidase n=1 Tax=Thiobacillus denitrificans TaxID=36861 RepID=UPI0009EA1DAE|nr:S8 family serine peptidase [Thiobacillus denitrificans]